MAFLCALSAAVSAEAQPVVVPPKPVHVDVPELVPEGADDVTVELTIDLSARGTVDDARVISPPNPKLDEAALRILRAATFSPATKDGVPVPARIKYALVFRAADLDFGDALPVLMTSKDAVKCRAFSDARLWELPVEARLEPGGGEALLERVATLVAARP